MRDGFSVGQAGWRFGLNFLRQARWFFCLLTGFGAGGTVRRGCLALFGPFCDLPLSRLEVGHGEVEQVLVRTGG